MKLWESKVILEVEDEDPIDPTVGGWGGAVLYPRFLCMTCGVRLWGESSAKRHEDFHKALDTLAERVLEL